MKQEKGKNKSYKERNEIEKIIKEKCIDRNSFYEVAKAGYKQIIHRLYYTFCDYHNFPTIQIKYMWIRLRGKLEQSELIPANGKDWNTYIDSIDHLIPEKASCVCYYLIVDGGWVYQGSIKEIKKILYEYPQWMEDFYLFPMDYRWLIIHCEDGACMCRVWKSTDSPSTLADDKSSSPKIR